MRLKHLFGFCVGDYEPSPPDKGPWTMTDKGPWTMTVEYYDEHWARNPNWVPPYPAPRPFMADCWRRFEYSANHPPRPA